MPIEHTLKWSQDDPLAVESWEFQYSPNGTAWYWVQHVQETEDCANCFQAIITTPDQMMMVRMRSIGLSGASSEWSNAQSLPEPTFGDTLLLAAMLMLIIARRFRIFSRSKDPQG